MRNDATILKLLDTLMLALDIDASKKALDLLAEIAGYLIDAGETTQAAQVVAFVSNQPQVSRLTSALTEQLFIQLAEEMYPIEIRDVLVFAQRATFEDVIRTILETTHSS